MGGHNRLKMADLRAVVESLGHTDVSTYLQSGNVVFTAENRTTTGVGVAVSKRLLAQCGLNVHVLIRTATDMASIVAANPYERDDPTRLVVTFLANKAVLPDLDLDTFAPEGLSVHGNEVYLDLPFGQAKSRLLAALAKVTVDDGTSTSRNWRTVLALTEMSAH